jgi:hypothetical protein
MHNEYHFLAIVSGSQEEKEKQKSEIMDYCKKALDVPPSGIEFMDRENFIFEKLKELKEWKENGIEVKDIKAEYVIVITDLRVISINSKILASNLYDILVNRHTRIEVVKEEHRKILKQYQPERLIVLTPERTLAGLEELCQDILKDDV